MEVSIMFDICTYCIFTLYSIYWKQTFFVPPHNKEYQFQQLGPFQMGWLRFLFDGGGRCLAGNPCVGDFSNILQRGGIIWVLTRILYYVDFIAHWCYCQLVKNYDLYNNQNMHHIIMVLNQSIVVAFFF